MAAALLLLLLLVPTAAGAQLVPPPSTLPPPTIYVPPTLYPNVNQPGSPGSPGGVIEISPRIAPPPTIPSGPDIFLPVPTVPPGAARPTKTFDFRPSASVIEEFSDNFNQVSKGKRSNLRSGVAPAFTVIFEDGPFSGSGGYDLLGFYDTLPDELGLHHNLAGYFAWQIAPLFRLSLTEAFTKNDEPTRADRLNLRQGRQEFTTNTTGFNADYLGPLFQAGAFYRLSLFDSPGEETFAHTMGLTTNWALSSIHSLAFRYEYLLTETESRPTSAANVTTNVLVAPTATRTTTTTTGHQFTTSFTRDLRSDLTAGITGTYAFRNQEQTRAPDSDFRRWNISLFTNYVVPNTIVLLSNIGVAQLSGSNANDKPLITSLSSLTYWFGPATLSGTLEHGFSETFGTAGASAGVVETLGVSASLSYQFTPLFRGSIGGSYRENKPTGIGVGSGTTDEKTITGTAALSYQILRWLVSTLDYAHTQVENSNTPGTTGTGTTAPRNGYTENRFRLSLSALFY